jgi:hypothetical protein
MKILIPLLVIACVLSYADEAGLGLVTGMKGSTIYCYGDLKVNFEGTKIIFVSPNNTEIPGTRLSFPFTATVIEPPATVKDYGSATYIKILKFYEMKNGQLVEREFN